jgi:preprotein translocase subunit SecG
MGFIIGLLTFFMVLDCIVLVLLVLIQLPKKEAGAGLAFGGAASDALFGAGSGNVLTKITKYAATIFFVMAIVLSMLQKGHYGRTSGFQQRLEQPISATPGAPAPVGTAKSSAPGPAAVAPLTSTTTPQPESTNAAPANTTSAPPK